MRDSPWCPVAVPMILLYLLGIMVAAIFGKKREVED